MTFPNRATELFLKLSVLLLIGFFMSGCVPEYYYGQAHTIPTPVLNSPETGNETYISGAFDIGDGSNNGERNLVGKINLQHGYTGKFFSLGAHSEFYLGSYKIKKVKSMKGKNLSYYGFSPQLNASLFIPYRSNRYGIYGLTGPVYEYGDYPDWLEKADEEGLIRLNSGYTDFFLDIFDNNEYMSSVGLFFEHIKSPDEILSFKMGIGTVGFFYIITQYRKGRSLYKLGIGSSLSVSYGMAF